MPNTVDVNYARTGQSTKIDKYGMREMQQKAFAVRDAQYLLLKAPPASGKSRALMFIALDKLVNQKLKKVIVAVPCPVRAAPAQNWPEFKSTSLLKVTTPVPSAFFSTLELSV